MTDNQTPPVTDPPSCGSYPKVAPPSRQAAPWAHHPSTGARVCRVCGCDDLHACVTHDGPCYWIAPGLCSACATLTPLS